MKILYVAFSNSIHSVRWINQVANIHEVHLFPSIDTGISHPQFNNINIYHLLYSPLDNLGHNLKLFGMRQPDTEIEEAYPRHIIHSLVNLILFNLKKIIQKFIPNYQVFYLHLLIWIIKPDIIHSLEMQSGGYLVDRVKKSFRGKFPVWIVSNWGSDIYLFGKRQGHKVKIRSVLKNCDYYMCECQRDIRLARNFGFKGKAIGVMPNAGGYDTQKYLKYRKIKTSRRKSIMIKGYQGWAGRSLVALHAIDRVGRLLREKNIRLILYSTSGNVNVEDFARKIAKRHALSLKIVPQFTNQDKIIKLHCQSRISIGLSISDGISTSLLEAMLAGSFPIQSYTACADEWIIDTVSGYLVPPEDNNKVQMAILKALKDDNLVDQASRVNWHTIKKRAEYVDLRNEVLNIYDRTGANSSQDNRNLWLTRLKKVFR